MTLQSCDLKNTPLSENHFDINESLVQVDLRFSFNVLFYGVPTKNAINIFF